MPDNPELEAKCSDCGFTPSVQVCYCVWQSSIQATYYGCPSDTAFPADSLTNCEDLLQQSNLDPLPCSEEIMCPVPGPTNPVEATCAFCGDSTIDVYHCAKDNLEEVFASPGCAGNFGYEKMLRINCADAIGKPTEDLESYNFYVTSETCPSDTTGGDATGGDTGDTSTGDAVFDCDLWDPASEITYNSGTYYVGVDYVNDLISNPMPLVDCDDARLSPLPGGSYVLRYSNAGELLYELGLRDGDIPLYLNGYPLQDPSDTIFAFGELWFIEGETEYELIVLRGGRPVTRLFSLPP